MNRTLLALGLLVLPTPVLADYWFCEYTQPDPKTPTSYYSEIFGTADEHVGARMDERSMGTGGRPPIGMPGGMSGTSSSPSRRELGEAFAQYITRDRAHGAASCESSPTRSGAERDLQRRKDKAIEKKRAVVQSDWIYSTPDR